MYRFFCWRHLDPRARDFRKTSSLLPTEERWASFSSRFLQFKPSPIHGATISLHPLPAHCFYLTQPHPWSFLSSAQPNLNPLKVLYHPSSVGFLQIVQQILKVASQAHLASISILSLSMELSSLHFEPTLMVRVKSSVLELNFSTCWTESSLCFHSNFRSYFLADFEARDL